jgi:hypothetical protein
LLDDDCGREEDDPQPDRIPPVCHGLICYSRVHVALGVVFAYADARSPGQLHFVPNATTHDANGRAMRCNPTMTGTRDEVWQYAAG